MTRGESCVGVWGVGIEGDGFEPMILRDRQIEIDETISVGFCSVLSLGDFGEEDDIGTHALDDGCDLFEARVVWGVEIGVSDILYIECRDAECDRVWLARGCSGRKDAKHEEGREQYDGSGGYYGGHSVIEAGSGEEFESGEIYLPR